ncbi:MAG: hypothetical protein VX574_07810 [Myxococcota bacterium]|nr:hypothetical protein [Myxococcota bacterium]
MTTDYERTLGVVEAIAAARDQCPSGMARVVAEGALEASKGAESRVLREQAWLVMNALQGWRGERADQVRRSLASFLESD